jgi:electron transport complex protein RnfG
MNENRREILRVVTTLTVVCALAALVLGGAFVATHRYREVASRRDEQQAILGLLQLDASANVLEVRQYLAAAREEVVYQAAPYGEPPRREVVFALDGRLVSARALTGATPVDARTAGEHGWVALGRVFVARRGSAAAGFVVEGECRGYKNRIRFFVGLTPAFEIAGVRVLEHEEDPGLGAEVATPVFQGQFLGRTAEHMASLTVTRDPMPEDWRSALATLARTPVTAWRDQHAALLAREGARPIYAVTGATISSRALTDGVRETVDHFQRRWALLAPQLGSAS